MACTLLQEKITNGTFTTGKTELWLKASQNDETDLVKVHASAMLALVADAAAVRITNIPETLLLDVRRLSALQNGFNRIVDGCTIIVTVQHVAQNHATDFAAFSKLVVDMEV